MIYEEFIKDTIKNNHITVFMKGNSDRPMCGFSARMVQLLDHLQLEYKDVNILEDHPTFAMELKELYGWPTSPQLFIGGKLVGGSDIAIEMFQSGELQKLLEMQSPAS